MILIFVSSYFLLRTVNFGMHLSLSVYFTFIRKFKNLSTQSQSIYYYFLHDLFYTFYLVIPKSVSSISDHLSKSLLLSSLYITVITHKEHYQT